VVAFGHWMAVAIEASQLYEKLESLARLEERPIGMDLHDGVIQSITPWVWPRGCDVPPRE
jgi:signal transduction histidine kinase